MFPKSATEASPGDGHNHNEADEEKIQILHRIKSAKVLILGIESNIWSNIFSVFDQTKYSQKSPIPITGRIFVTSLVNTGINVFEIWLSVFFFSRNCRFSDLYH